MVRQSLQGKLKQLRSVIKAAAPGAEEKISYSMPYYEVRSANATHYGYKGRLVYFAYAKSHIGLYAMPMTLEGLKEEVKKYHTGKATLSFPLNEDLPIALIKKLIKAGVRDNEAKKEK